jgi:hypothetical protein
VDRGIRREVVDMRTRIAKQASEPTPGAGRSCTLIVDFENGDGFGGERQVYFAVSNRSGCITVE